MSARNFKIRMIARGLSLCCLSTVSSQNGKQGEEQSNSIAFHKIDRVKDAERKGTVFIDVHHEYVEKKNGAYVFCDSAQCRPFIIHTDTISAPRYQTEPESNRDIYTSPFDIDPRFRHGWGFLNGRLIVAIVVALMRSVDPPLSANETKEIIIRTCEIRDGVRVLNVEKALNEVMKIAHERNDKEKHVSDEIDESLFNFEPDIRLFLVFAFMNAAGYDFDYAKDYDPVSQEIRSHLKTVLEDDFRNRIAQYYSNHLKDYDYLGWDAFALYLSAPPEMDVINDTGSFRITEALRGVLPLFREFYTKARVEELWDKYYPLLKKNNHAFEAYADLALRQITDYCRVDKSVYYSPGRKIHFVICPQISHSVAFTHTQSEKTIWMIYGPMPGSMANPYPFYHEALHLVVNPIIRKNKGLIDKLKSLFDMSEDRRSDIYVSIEDLVSESFVRTLDKVLYGNYESKERDEILKWVENEYKMGHLLSLAFFEKLPDYDSRHQTLADFIRKFLIEIDIESELERWKKCR